MGILYQAITNPNYQGIGLTPERCTCGQVGERVICRRCKGYNADKWCVACQNIKSTCNHGGEKG